jgi:hypothetical protein
LLLQLGPQISSGAGDLGDVDERVLDDSVGLREVDGEREGVRRVRVAQAWLVQLASDGFTPANPGAPPRRQPGGMFWAGDPAMTLDRLGRDIPPGERQQTGGRPQ